MVVGNIQLGKNGVTENFLGTLRNHFQKYNTMKITVLASARESKADVKKFSLEILEKLGVKYTARVIGFTIIIKHWRQAQR